jgi:hypothetical protein
MLMSALQGALLAFQFPVRTQRTSSPGWLHLHLQVLLQPSTLPGMKVVALCPIAVASWGIEFTDNGGEGGE